jgi:hypothetical protein
MVDRITIAALPVDRRMGRQGRNGIEVSPGSSPLRLHLHLTPSFSALLIISHHHHHIDNIISSTCSSHRLHNHTTLITELATTSSSHSTPSLNRFILLSSHSSPILISFPLSPSQHAHRKQQPHPTSLILDNSLLSQHEPAMLSASVLTLSCFSPSPLLSCLVLLFAVASHSVEGAQSSFDAC